MLQSIWDDIRREFDHGHMINRIIIVNVTVYLFINLFWVVLRLSNGWQTPPFYSSFLEFFMISDSILHLLTHPWSVITHMFMHESFSHILWNMLYLLWFGRIFGDLLGDRRVLPLYILGGLGGFLAYFFAYNLLNISEATNYALGASGAVFCILTATGLYAPEYQIRLLLIGNVRLKYIVLVAILVQLIGLGNLNNIGGTFDHIGGIVTGILFTFYLKQGTDITQPIYNIIEAIRNSFSNLLKPSKEHTQRGPRRTSSTRKFWKESNKSSFNELRRKNKMEFEQEHLDAILDKIKEKGYNSLSKEEKDYLFRASNRK